MATHENRRTARPVRRTVALLGIATLTFGTVSLVASGPAAAAAPGHWFHADDLVHRQNTDVAVRLDDGGVLLIGGEEGAASTNVTQVFSYTVNLWASGPSMTTDRFEPTAVKLGDGRVLVAGGTHFTAGQSDLVARASAEIFDPRTDTWTKTGSMHVARAGATGTLLADGRVLVAGGYDASSALPESEIYNPATGTWKSSGPLRIARTGHVATLLPDGDVLVVGGLALLSPNDVPAIGYAERWSPATGRWQLDAALTTPRAYPMAATLKDGSFLVAGGYSDVSGTQRHVTATVERYLPATHAWVPAAPMSTPRAFSASATLPTGRVLVAGGVTNARTTTFRSIATTEIYNPNSDTWAGAAALPERRFGGVGVLLGSGSILVASGLSTYLDLNSDPQAARRFVP